MWLLIVEALIAGGMFVFIVWWTVSGRRKPEQDLADSQPAALEADYAADNTTDSAGDQPGASARKPPPSV